MEGGAAKCRDGICGWESGETAPRWRAGSDFRHHSGFGQGFCKLCFDDLHFDPENFSSGDDDDSARSDLRLKKPERFAYETPSAISADGPFVEFPAAYHAAFPGNAEFLTGHQRGEIPRCDTSSVVFHRVEIALQLEPAVPAEPETASFDPGNGRRAVHSV